MDQGHRQGLLTSWSSRLRRRDSRHERTQSAASALLMLLPSGMIAPGVERGGERTTLDGSTVARHSTGRLGIQRLSRGLALRSTAGRPGRVIGRAPGGDARLRQREDSDRLSTAKKKLSTTAFQRREVLPV